jgi:hypothetical protein
MDLPLTSERGLSPRHKSFLWKLDETEGPHRARSDQVYLYNTFSLTFTLLKKEET